MIRFEGTTFLNTRYIDGYKVGQIRQKHDGGFSHTKVSGDIYTLILDPGRNKKVREIETDLQTLAKESAEKAGLPLKQIYHYSKKWDLSARWEKHVVSRLKRQARK